ncbi:MAG TPA: hypothetical protein VFG04_02965 [Planctomycetaceae bacterium]|jgi:hypothetical protein|nr:hypothetical protein [Planctomycetaceae bacterium]
MHRRDFLQITCLGAAGLNHVLSSNATAAEHVPLIGDAPQLFVDLDHVEFLSNVRQVFHAAEKYPHNPVLRKVKPWENDRGTWGSVLYDEQEKIFKCWYGGKSGRQKEFRPGSLSDCNVLCYATSRDGVHWDRPALGLHEVMGTRENNVVVGDDHHNGLGHWESTLKDPLEIDSRRRYKALGWSSYDWDGPLSGIYSMTSPDGLCWTHTPEPVFHFHIRKGTNDLGPVGDAQSLMIDTLRHRYVACLRSSPHRAQSVSQDFVTWTPPSIHLRGRPGEIANTIYNHMGFVYGDRYLGLLTYFAREPKDPVLTLQLLTSRDGETWQRPDTAKPLIDVGTIGEWDRFIIMLTGAPPIRVGDKLYIYYRGMAARHKPYEGKDDALHQGGGLGLATLRVDGFASLDASYDGGRVTTKPFRTHGRQLRVNAKADCGRLRAEVLDGSGHLLPGFGRDDCRVMQVDCVDEPIVWKEVASLDTLKDRPIQLRFHLENVRLYSYRIA